MRSVQIVGALKPSLHKKSRDKINGFNYIFYKSVSEYNFPSFRNGAVNSLGILIV